MKRTLLISFISFLFLQVNAQGRSAADQLKKANKEFELLRYAYAIPYYQKYLNKVKKDSLANNKLATCYFRINEYDSAIKYFEIAKELGAKIGNQLPELYAIKGNYEKSVNGYKSINEINKTRNTDARLYGFSNPSQFLQDSLDFKLSTAKVNTPFNEFGAVLYKDGFVFESNRIANTKKQLKKRKVFGWDGGNYTKLYFGNSKDSNVTLFSSEIVGKLNVGAISFTEDGKKAYYTRNSRKKGAKGFYQLEIWETRLKEGKWGKGYKLFFNNSNFSYFHPAISPDGKRLYYVSDDTTGKGGTDIYYVDRSEDGSWQATRNMGQEVNTESNELFPTFYDGTFFFSSNGHPGLGGLDIYRLVKSNKSEAVVKNMGFPINSSKDDFSLSIKGNAGLFSSNRNGNDDILLFDFEKVFVDVSGIVSIDNKLSKGTKVYLMSEETSGDMRIIDSAFVQEQGQFTMKARPNKEYKLVVVDEQGGKNELQVSTVGYNKLGSAYSKAIGTLNVQSSLAKLKALQEKEAALKAADYASMTSKFKTQVDSLSSLTKDFVVLHHPFDQVYVVKDDLDKYYALIERVKGMNGKKIVIVSAADCVGEETYNDDLSSRRANRIFRTLSKLQDNDIVIKHVGEMELLTGCNEAPNQKMNRYSYVFIMNK